MSSDGLVEYLCPSHGTILAAPQHALVTCRCGKECAPEGMTAAEQRTRYRAALEASRARKAAATTVAPARARNPKIAAA